MINISINRVINDTFPMEIYVKDDNGNPYDLKDFDIVELNVLKDDVIITSNGYIEDFTTGKIIVPFSQDMTNTIGTYSFNVKIKNTTKNIIITLIVGTLYIINDF